MRPVLQYAEGLLHVVRSSRLCNLQSEWDALVERINALKPPSGGPPNPVTKLWPRHLSKEVLAQQQGAGQQQRDSSLSDRSSRLKEGFPEYFTMYGYE